MPASRTPTEACGIETTAGVWVEGVRYKNLVYFNAFIRDQRMKRASERIAQPGEKISIKIDPFDLGAITLVTDDDTVPVPCLDDSMRGRSLSRWMDQQTEKKTSG